MIYKINTVPKSEFKGEIVKHLDADKYLRWLAGVVFTSNYDGFVHNYALYRNHETGLLKSFRGITTRRGEETFTGIGWMPIMSEYKGLIP